MNERDQIQQAIAHLELQRALLGNAVVGTDLGDLQGRQGGWSWEGMGTESMTNGFGPIGYALKAHWGREPSGSEPGGFSVQDEEL